MLPILFDSISCTASKAFLYMETICYLYGFWETFLAINFIELAISNVISITACLFRVNFTHVLNDLFCLSSNKPLEPFLPLASFIGDNSVQFS
jgi:hypothetical protein